LQKDNTATPQICCKNFREYFYKMPIKFRGKTANAFAAIFPCLILANCNAIDIARAGVNIGIPIIAKIADLAAPDLSLDKSLHIESLTTPTLCGLALSIDYPSWDMRYPDEIAEAQRRGYTASKCFNLNGFAQEKAERYRIKAAARASEEQDRIAAAQGVADVQE
jgi:hypothetical protein